MESSTSIEITRGDRALDRLDDTGFVAAWAALHERCPWATTFQSFDFVDTWYRLYAPEFEPIIVEGRDDAGRLTGLLTLARARSGQTLVGAGEVQAEYQGWLSAADDSAAYMRPAINELERLYSRGRLLFNYLPPDAPTDWAHRTPGWPRRTHLRSLTGGLMDLADPDAIEASLRKSGNRSKLSRLRRIGDVRLETVTSVDVLEREMDEITVLCDLRQGAINDAMPFADDPFKRVFHVDLARRGLLHTTILRVGSRIGSVHLDLRDGDEMLLYLIAHAPTFARDSPGSLHILLLGQQLGALGYSTYDLSPGGGYKERFATTERTVERMAIPFGRRGRTFADIRTRARNGMTRALASTGRTPERAVEDLTRLRARLRPAVAPGNDDQSRVERSVLIIKGPGSQPPSETEAPRASGGEMLAVDRVPDLLMDDPVNGRPGQAFLRAALVRLEAGHHVLTRTDRGRLVEAWWMSSLDGAVGLPGDAASARGTSEVMLYDPLVVAGPGSSVDDAVMRLSRVLGAMAPGARTWTVVRSSEEALISALVRAGAEPVDDVEGGAVDRSRVERALHATWPTSRS